LNPNKSPSSHTCTNLDMFGLTTISLRRRDSTRHEQTQTYTVRTDGNTYTQPSRFAYGRPVVLQSRRKI
jgi:hypothetical protein